MLVRLVKLQYYRAVKGFTILLNDARPKPGNATARTHCGKHTGHTARMAKEAIFSKLALYFEYKTAHMALHRGIHSTRSMSQTCTIKQLI